MRAYPREFRKVVYIRSDWPRTSYRLGRVSSRKILRFKGAFSLASYNFISTVSRRAYHRRASFMSALKQEVLETIWYSRRYRRRHTEIKRLTFYLTHRPLS